MTLARSTALALLVATGCGSRTDLLDPDDVAAMPHVDASTIDAQRPMDAAVEAGSDATPANGNFGYVVARSDPALGLASLATAVFYESFPSACALAIDTDTCAIGYCPSSDDGFAQSAGNVAVTTPLGNMALSPMPTPNDGVHYTTATDEAAIFAASAVVRVAADGAVVPRFDTSVVFPGAASIVQPSFLTNVDVDVTKPLALAWSATTAPEILFYLTDLTSPRTAPLLICYFASSASSAQIPAGYLSRFETMLSSTSVEAAFFPVARTRIAQGDWHVTINALGRGAARTATLH